MLEATSRTIQNAGTADTTLAVDGSETRRWQVALVCTAVLALATAWMCAAWGPLHGALAASQIAETSAVRVMLLAGAAPWLLQVLAATALVAAALLPRLKRDWTPLAFAFGCALAAGFVFWGGWTYILWGTDPQQAVLEVTARSLAIKLGGGTLLESMLYRFVGPLVCPLTLSGPLVMQGWSFLWAGLSSLLIVCYWTWGAGFCNIRSEWERPTVRGTGWLFLVIVGYTSPAWLRLLTVAAGMG